MSWYNLTCLQAEAGPAWYDGIVNVLVEYNDILEQASVHVNVWQ